MPNYQPIPILIIVFFFSCFWSTLVGLRVLWRLLIVGPKKYFFVKERERPAVLDNPELGTHGYLSLKKLKIHYVANGEEGKPLMLFLHGFPEFWYSWRHQLKEFGKDYRAVAIDMRGYAESDKPQGIANYFMEELTGDVRNVIKALGYDKAIVVAHDWGGGVAWAFTQEYPEMVERLIVCNCPHGAALEKHIKTSFSQSMKSWYMLFFQMPCLPEVMCKAEDFKMMDMMFTAAPMGAKPGSFKLLDMEAFKYTFGNPGCITPPINYYRAAMRFRPNRGNRSKIPVPSLLIWGTNDQALEKVTAEMTRKYCENLTVRYIEGASHWVQQEEPQTVNQMMREFLGTEKSD